MGNDINIVGLAITFLGFLAVIYFSRIIRLSRVKELLGKTTSVKLYIAENQTSKIGRIMIISVNGARPAHEPVKDSGGKYLIIPEGENTITAGFMTLGAFILFTILPFLGWFFIIRMKKNEVHCSVTAGNSYIIDFDGQNPAFTIKEK